MKDLLGYVLYFAYRTDIRRENFLAHFPSAEWLGLARLEDHRLAFENKGEGILRHQLGTVVFGGLWLVPASELDLLDELSGATNGRSQRATYRIISPAGPSAEAMTYVGSGTGSAGTPDPGYLESILAGAMENQAPESYLDYLRMLGEKLSGGTTVTAAVADS